MKREMLKFLTHPRATYFIADIAANHDGSLTRAKHLIKLAAEAGADAAKFQNFRAETIVSRRGFQELGGKLSHQRTWENDVFDVYKNAELPIEWTDELRETCDDEGIEYFTAVYDLESVDYFKDKMPFYKIGSGDITFLEGLIKIAKSGLPVILATGASDIEEVKQAVEIFQSSKTPLVIMQCNTNYTASESNSNYVNLNVLKEFSRIFPDCGLGLSDHTAGHVAVLGAVTLGARFIEKHFTDDKTRKGPDHVFSLDANDWKKMVDDVRLLESALGDGIKKLESNEVDAQIVQRRALRFSKDLPLGHVVTNSDLVALRPIPKDGISPMKVNEVLGKKTNRISKFDELVTFNSLDD